MNSGRIESPRLVSVQFLREQDGPPERELKARLTSIFSAGETPVDRAYLAQVRYVGSSPAVALCLAAEKRTQDAIVRRVSSVFAELAGSKEHLDVLFITAEDEKRLAEVCKPFFVGHQPN